MLAPLSSAVGAEKFTWTEDTQTAFEVMKALICMEMLTRYADHDKKFEVYTDASDYQMGA